MDEKIQKAIEQIIEDTLKDQAQWEADYGIHREKNEEKEEKEEQKKVRADAWTGTEDQEQPKKIERIKIELRKRIKEKYRALFKEKNYEKKKIRTAAGIAAGILAVVYFAGVWYYRDRLLEGTRIGEVLCGNMTVEEAEQAIKEQVENYSIEIFFKDSTEKIRGKDIGYTYQPGNETREALEEQNAFLWPLGLFGGRSFPADHTVSVDQEKIREKLLSFPSMQKENMTPAKDAYIAFENNQFVIKKETQGTVIDENLFLEKVKTGIEEGRKKISAQEEGVYVLPAILQEDESLKRQQEVWNSCAAVTVTYLFGDKQEVLDGMRVKDWLTYDEAGNYVEDPEGLMENIRLYAAELAAKYDTQGQDRVIRSTATGENITVSGGDYGFIIDQEAESQQLLTDIQNHVNIQREPVYAIRGETYGSNDVGDTYVEVDLTQQHLWYYKDGSLLMESDFVSGTYYADDRRTPGGTYYLKYKQRDQVLRPAPNPDGSYDYESPVSYWMPFNGGIGFHDADWRWEFGGSIYLYGGSHGCINLPVSFAGGFYESLEAGCPIICFYR